MAGDGVLPMDMDIRLVLMGIVAELNARGYRNAEAYALVRPDSTSVSVRWSSGEKFFHKADSIRAAAEWSKSLELPYEAGIGPWFSVRPETQTSITWDGYPP
jgi:hypothetical protein